MNLEKKYSGKELMLLQIRIKNFSSPIQQNTDCTVFKV